MAVFRVPVEITWSGPGSPGVNVWHVRTTEETAVGNLQLQSQVNNIRNLYVGLNGAAVPADGIFAAGTTFNLGDIVNVQTREFADADWVTVESNSNGSDIPPMAQLVISWRTTLAARRGQGRTFFGPLSAKVLDTDGSVVQAYVESARTMAADFINSFAGGTDGAVGVYGLQSPAPAGTTDYAALPHVLRDITAARVRDQFAVLRSRRD